VAEGPVSEGSITVYDVPEQRFAEMSTEQIINAFPEPELEDIHAYSRVAADRERQIATLRAQ
jgi:uncharacterized protein (DUF433 family)